MSIANYATMNPYGRNLRRSRAHACDLNKWMDRNVSDVYTQMIGNAKGIGTPLV